MGLSVLPSEILSVHRHIEMGSLWTQLPLQFMGYAPIIFINFFDLVFSGSITIRYLVGATPPRVFHRFETMHTCSTWSVDMHVVLGLSSDYFLSTFTTFLT